MSVPSAGADEPTRRWLADEMLGKLARYLRFLGDDTVYARGFADPDLRARAVAERRTLLTRDRALAHATSGSVLIRSVRVQDQLGELFARYPALAHPPPFDRCPECNAMLASWPGETQDGPGATAASLVRARGTAVSQCPACRRYYWDGSHADRIRRVIADASTGARPA